MISKEYIVESGQFENVSSEMTQRLLDNPDVAHAAFGIGDEFLELMIEWEEMQMNISRTHPDQKLIKEAGDILWYIAILCRKYDYTIDTNAHYSDKDIEISMVLAVQSILSALKKHLIYGKELDHSSMQFWINVIATKLQNLCQTSIEDIMQRNYDKLYARYGKEYTNEAAINKDETKE